jgi:mono/diheme cytochrome c family protein
MPTFARKNGGTLTEMQIQILVHEIKGIPYRIYQKETDPEDGKIAADPAGIKPAWGKPPAVPDAPPYRAAEGSNGNRQAGAQLFQSACAGCHGEQGQGQSKEQPADVKKTRHLDAPGAMRINDRVFLALNSDQILRRYIITGRPDLNMPDYRGKSGRGNHFTPLTAQQVNDLTALLAYWRIEGK